MSRTAQWVVAAAVVLAAGVAEAGTATFLEGAADPFTGATYLGVQDALILKNNEVGERNLNYGAADFISAGTLIGFTANSQRHSLVRFDLTSMAGHYTSITSATLRLYRTVGGANENSNVMQLYRLADANAGWIEGAGIGVITAAADATWNERGNGAWAGSAGASTAGTDYVAAMLASAAYTPTTTFLDFTLNDLSFLSTWIAGGTNAGFFLRTQDETTVASRFTMNSSEFATVSLRPQLIIQYSDAVGVPLPPAAWSGLGVLGVLGLVSRRRGRRARA